ncbi:alpha/beta hydrolase [Oxalicibacterium faecigallinarum]|uniref:Esterase n=1 Tax=Oxalicibacterium faecigallinarum TaxID=573741 RepID=A0A8J3AVR9_9BURK|nr:alpha/beta hydrolase [Oxalicibacterium faecigallinarum]GGI20102.1 esterase [Oxalicibacterium faecigallinarum]
MSEAAIYRGMDKATLDAAYNNSKGVTNSSELLADFDQRSAALRAAYPQHLDLRFGPAERNRVDYFPADKPGPLMVFIHGGYWQMRAKETFSFLAAGPLAHGFHVAMIGYTLAPEQTLSGIVDEVRLGIRWLREHVSELGGDTQQMILSGWSAGGHLTAMCLDEPGIVAGVAISGLFDLEPIRLSYVNDKLRLSDAEVVSMSPAKQALSAKPLLITYGTGELSGLQDQSTLFAKLRKGLPGNLLPIEGANHFTILDQLADPQGAITQALVTLNRSTA